MRNHCAVCGQRAYVRLCGDCLESAVYFVGGVAVLIGVVWAVTRW